MCESKYQQRLYNTIYDDSKQYTTYRMEGNKNTANEKKTPFCSVVYIFFKSWSIAYFDTEKSSCIINGLVFKYPVWGSWRERKASFLFSRTGEKKY